MGYSLLREKNVVFLMDALWSAGYEIDQPTKWQNPPFNDDWSSSIFISLDNVAIESVGYDFLRTEYTSENHPGLTYPQMDGADDYLEQAADSANWTDSIPFYDPEDDGTPIPWSLGVHEHWNNATDREYTRNLGTGDGIELVSVFQNQGGIDENIETLARPVLFQNSPNPFSYSTSIKYNIANSGNVELSIYNLSGQKIETLVNETQSRGTYSASWNARLSNGSQVPNGVYIYRLIVTTEDTRFENAGKMLLIK
ncbi:MAG: FlgD immunoglobulin-like domain containing protein [candidate division WOR-3 bacterium]